MAPAVAGPKFCLCLIGAGCHSTSHSSTPYPPCSRVQRQPPCKGDASPAAKADRNAPVVVPTVAPSDCKIPRAQPLKRAREEGKGRVLDVLALLPVRAGPQQKRRAFEVFQDRFLTSPAAAAAAAAALEPPAGDDDQPPRVPRRARAAPSRLPDPGAPRDSQPAGDTTRPAERPDAEKSPGKAPGGAPPAPAVQKAKRTSSGRPPTRKAAVVLDFQLFEDKENVDPRTGRLTPALVKKPQRDALARRPLCEVSKAPKPRRAGATTNDLNLQRQKDGPVPTAAAVPQIPVPLARQQKTGTSNY